MFDGATFEKEGCNKIHEYTNVMNSQIGWGTFIGTHCSLPNSIIGRFCSIGHNIRVIYTTHPSRKFVSTSPSFYSTLKQNGLSFVERNCFDEQLRCESGRYVEVGNDVWIGNDVILLGGVIIGDGAIIAAGSVVTHSVPPYSIYGGVPAKQIRMRFANEEVDFLKDLKWWNNTEEWMRENAEKFCDIDELMNSIGSNRNQF